MLDKYKPQKSKYNAIQFFRLKDSTRENKNNLADPLMFSCAFPMAVNGHRLQPRTGHQVFMKNLWLACGKDDAFKDILR